MVWNFITVILASIVSIIFFSLGEMYFIGKIIYAIVVINCFFIFSLPISLLSDYITKEIPKIGWLLSGICQIMLSLAVIFPICIILLFSLTSFYPESPQHFFSYTRPFWLLILINSTLFWIINTMLKLIFRSNRISKEEES